MSKKEFWVAFSSMQQIDNIFIEKLYTHFNDIEKAFNASLSSLKEIEGLSVKKTENFLKERDKIDIEKTYNEILKRDLSIISYDDEAYPKLLKEICNPPMILYYKGDISSCNLNKTLAVVGSRRASTSGKSVLSKIISEFTNTDICIVSGLAYGIDTVSHQASLSGNIKTIGVIAGGFDYIYPRANKLLYDQIENGGGAILTEYYPTFQPLPYRFPQRNRIITGLSYGTLVAEASLNSGALISANLCLEQGRELMCIPGLISNPNTEGIYKLLKNGATLVTCAQDILNALNWEVKQDVQLNLNLELSTNEKDILSIIEIEPKGFDTILQLSKQKPEELLVTLTALEMNGLVKQIEGEKYTIA